MLKVPEKHENKDRRKRDMQMRGTMEKGRVRKPENQRQGIFGGIKSARGF